MFLVLGLGPAGGLAAAAIGFIYAERGRIFGSVLDYDQYAIHRNP